MSAKAALIDEVLREFHIAFPIRNEITIAKKLIEAREERDAEYEVRKHVLRALEGQGLPKVLPENGYGVIQDAYKLRKEADTLRTQLAEAIKNTEEATQSSLAYHKSSVEWKRRYDELSSRSAYDF